MGFLRFALGLYVFLLLSPLGWAQSKNLAPGFKELPLGSKIAVMPIDVELFNMSAGGVMEPQAEWTATALALMREALRNTPATSRVEFVDIKDDGDETVDELNRLHGAVGSAIAVHQFGAFPLPTKEGRLAWSLGSDVRAIGEKTGARYALFLFVRDSYASAERKAAIVFAALLGVGLAAGIQYGYASLVDLENGDVVWFNRLLRGTGDLREPEAAKETVQALLRGLPE